MKIVNIIGGLGNQMFQYAFALSLKDRFPNEQILIDTSHFNYVFIKKIGAANLHNGFEISKIFPNAELVLASPWDLAKVTWYMPNYILSRLVRKLLPKRKTEYVVSAIDNFTYLEDVYQIRGNCYYEGVWESIQYLMPIRTTLIKVFAHPKPNDVNQTYINELKENNSVGLHARRGDYQYDPAFGGICDVNYYTKAIDYLIKDNRKRKFYIFSNDIDWCKDNIVPLLKDNEYTFVTENRGADCCWDMFLMTYCKELIIANSSFSWWGAFLNSCNAKVIAPAKWTNRDAVHDIWMPDWIKL